MHMKLLNIKLNEKSTGVFLVELAGPLDSFTHSIFDDKMRAILVPSTRGIVLDMKGVDYVSSMGIGSIFKVRNFMKGNRAEVAMINIQPRVQKVFDTVQAMPKEAIFESLSEFDAYLDQIQKDKKE